MTAPGWPEHRDAVKAAANGSTVREIAEATGLGRRTVRTYLDGLIGSGEVRRTGTRRSQGNPYTYRRPEERG